MALLKAEDIKEIAGHVSNGILVFVHKHTKEIRPLSDTENGAENWKAMFAELEADDKNWLKIMEVPLDDEIHLRKEFIEEVTDNNVKKQLTNALKRKNPIRNFQQAIQGDEILQIHWRNFSKGAYQDWVSNYIIDEYNY